MSSFLVVYSRSTGEVVVEEFSDPARAMSARLKRELVADGDTEVVVLSSASREDLYRTHSRYFQNSSEILRESDNYLKDNLASA